MSLDVSSPCFSGGHRVQPAGQTPKISHLLSVMTIEGTTHHSDDGVVVVGTNSISQSFGTNDLQRLGTIVFGALSGVDVLGHFGVGLGRPSFG